MDENHQDKTERKRTTTEDKQSLPHLSPEDDKKHDRLQKVRKKARQSLVEISLAIAGVIALIYVGYIFHWSSWVLFLVLIGILLLVLLVRAGYTVQWTGFKGKTLWNWLDLFSKIAIPIVVLVATIGFGLWQVHLADLQHQNDRNIAQDNRQNDLKIADDQQQEATLKAYLDDMTMLLLNNKLGSQAVADKTASTEATVVAHAKTLIVLRRLTDPQRKEEVFQFLYESHLIGYLPCDNCSIVKHVIDLSEADLSSVPSGDKFGFYQANFSGVDVSGAILYFAVFNGSNFYKANLSEAKLHGAELRDTDLNSADLSNVFLDEADLSFARLIKANLYNAFLKGADLSEADLSKANLTDADLRANLTDANFTDADLTNADLRGANLRGANLRGVNLGGATLYDEERGPAQNLTQQQLDQVYSCKNASLPPGLICLRNP